MSPDEERSRAHHPAGKMRYSMAKAKEVSEYAIRAGLCGSISGSGYVCNLHSHGQERKHMAQQRGGPYDGETYAEWDW